ncbi:MAG: hypothetical protein JOY68_06560 [Candidatus Dormibacteraeota bacterium]|nr:hypothetical protein [Candidatus Dormibacteraeota bacterium]MBV8445023.1 hypothetical protein [Candidatus Dormibacteraeota bacterium]
MTRRRRALEAGIFRGCCLGLILILAIVGFGAFLVDRAVAGPDLGAPAGPSHGLTELQIAGELASQLSAELASNPHAEITLSEQDLTVIAQANNPHPDRFHDVEALVRDGDVVVSAQTNEGPFTVTGVAYVTVALAAHEQLTVLVVRLDVGQITLPGFIRDHFTGSVSPSITVDKLFAAPALQPLRANLECVLVTAAGLVVGVHRPGATPNPGLCAGQPG